MITLFLATAITCMPTVKVGFKHPYTRLDEHYIKEGPYGCKSRYPKSPCLKKIEKVGPVDYQFTCGKEVKK